ncbi:MAG: protein kinase, partial [Deltaproteobacteria bacterium]|nr:protein kinase [Deltaproteobacteria bacterium]
MAAAPATGAGVFTPGETLAGKFEILRLLGKGGMGRVYLARDLRLGRKVAVKIIREDLATSPAVLERFLKEAKVTANLSHPNIVEIHDYGIHEGRPFIVLEHLLGEPLAARRTGKPQPDGIVLELVLPVVRALKHGHEHVPRIIHRDVKPENVFVCEDGRIKVLDFGLSGLVAPTAAPSRNVDPALVGLGAPREATRSTAGTLGYMAPEQFRGEDQDPRVDVWAVGVVLFEFLAGRRPFQDLEDDLEVFRKRVLSAAAMPDVRGAVPGVDPDLAGIVARCLAKDRDVRFPNAADLLAELERVAVRIRYRSEATGEPYRGLEPFSADDAAWFFGRGEDAAALLRALDSQALVGLIGPSGAGKTSLVQAGLARELRERGLGWEVLALRPGREPLRMLARRFVERTRADEDGLVETLRMEPGRAGQALRLLARKQGKRVLLFVDQAEELYTLSAAEPERRAFLAALLGAADDPHGPVRVLIAIRTDFVDRLAEHREFLKLLETGMLFLGPIDATGLAECLRRPAELKGYGIEAGIVADVVQALAARPGALPVLQMVGQKLWEARDEASRLLTRAAYDKAGGARGALAGHADAVLERLDPGTRELAGRVLCRLVTPERTRAAVLRSELQGLGDRAVLDGILDGLVRGRLLVVSGAGSDPSFELVHESLIDGWPRLRAWLDDDRSFADARETVRAAIRAGARLAGPLLQRVAAVFEAGPDRFSDEERAFLRANLASERRSRLRRLAVLLAIPTAVAIAALVAALLISRSERAAVEARDEADRQRQEAEGQSEKAARERNRAEAALSASQRAELAAVTARDDADRARAEAESRGEEIQRKKEELEGALAGQRKNLADAYRHLSGERLRDLRPDEAFLAASVSWTSDREADARAQVIQTFNAPSRVWAGPAAFSVRDFAFVPGTDIVVCATDRGLGAWSLGTGRLRWEERSHGIWSLDVTRDGRIMAVCGSGREIRILDPRSGAPVRTIESPDEVTGHLAFSPEGASLASSGLSTGKIRVWNVLTGQEIRVLEGEGSGMQWLDLAGIDDVLSTRDNQGTVVLLDPRSGREVRRFELQGGGFAVSRDGGLLAMGSRAGDLQVLDVRTDAVLSTLQGSRSLLHSLTFSPDARFLVSAGTDETVRLWNIATGRQVEVLGRRGTGTGPSDVAFSPDGRLIGWGDDVGTVRFRDMVDQKEIATLGGA